MVIAIISIITTIIMSGLYNARAKAYDSKVKQQLISFRTAAEIYFSNNGDKYGNFNNCNAGGPTSLFRSILNQNGSPGLYIDPANLPTGSNRICQATDIAYAVKISLYSGGYWCVDSTRASMFTTDNTATTLCQ